MSRNVNRITNYYSRIEAWNDWYWAAKRAEDEHYDLVRKYQPTPGAGHKKIDAATKQLCLEAGLPLPPGWPPAAAPHAGESLSSDSPGLEHGAPADPEHRQGAVS